MRNTAPLSLNCPSQHPAYSSQGGAGCQIHSQRLNSKMHVQPLCREEDGLVMTKRSLTQQFYLT